MAMGSIWHRTLVYFGMAEDADDEFGEHDEGTRDRSRGAERDLEETYRDRPNVRRLGPRRRGEDFDDIFADDAPIGQGARATPIRSVEPRRSPSEVHLVVPKTFNDAQQIADRFKNTVPVIINLQGAETDLAKRLIDFSSGLTYALNGGMQRVADKVFLLTPRDIEVSAEEKARLMERGFFNQY